MTMPEETSHCKAVPSHRLLIVNGCKNLKEVGERLGTQYKAQIEAGRQRWVEYFIKEEKSMTEEKLQELTAHAKVAILKSCPHTAAFLEGLTKSTGIDMWSGMLDFELENWDGLISMQKKKEKAVQKAAQIAAAVAEASADPPLKAKVRSRKLPKGHCTGLAFASSTNSQCAMVAQTVELPMKLYGQGDADMVLHLEWQVGPATQRVLCYDTDGRCCPVGLNSAGLGIGIFTLKQSQDVGFTRPSLTIQALLWELLLGQYTLASALQYLTHLPHTLMCGAALLLTDKSGAVNVELNADGVYFNAASQDLLIRRANHPLLDATKTHDCNSSAEKKYSIARLQHLDILLQAQAKKSKSKESIDHLTVGPAHALAALCGSDLILNSRALAVVVCDMDACRLFCLFKERWMTVGATKRRLESGKAQVHKVRRKLYMYSLNEISASENEEEMEEDTESDSDDIGTESDSDSDSDSDTESDSDSESDSGSNSNAATFSTEDGSISSDLVSPDEVAVPVGSDTDMGEFSPTNALSTPGPLDAASHAKSPPPQPKAVRLVPRKKT